MCRVVLVSLLASICQAISEPSQKIYFGNEFLAKFRTYFNSQGQDYESYSWLIHKSPRMQLEMGVYGKLAAFRPPYTNYVIQNYQMIVSIIPEIRKEFEDSPDFRNTRALHEYIALVQESLLRYHGILTDSCEAEQKRLKNPVIWLAEGVSWVLLFPIFIMSWVGLVGQASVRDVARSAIFRILAGIFTLIGVLGSVITITIGWNSFITTLRNLLIS
jgi:hypothetical protein